MSDLEFHVLLALGEGPSHGPTTGALYQVLRRLSDEALIAAVQAPKETDPRRRYFTLTPQGRRAAAAEAARLDALVRMARKRRLFPQRA
jgi:DNA-binding PadR family transcriptional regulator